MLIWEGVIVVLSLLMVLDDINFWYCGLFWFFMVFFGFWEKYGGYYWVLYVCKMECCLLELINL